MSKELIHINEIQNRIFTIRGSHVMIDSDLAELYDVELKRLNEQVRRNIERFPDKYRFQLTKEEYDFLRSQIATLKNNGRGKHRKYLPYVFTEQGVSMLSAVLHSKTAIRVSIQIIDAFVEMKRFLATNANLFQRLENVETKLLSSKIDADNKFEKIFKALEDKTIVPKQQIFFDGQFFDAYNLIVQIIRKAQKSVILIDNYIDETVLTMLTKRSKGCEAVIYTREVNKALQLDLQKHNAQYPEIEIKKLATAHDRFLIIDRKTVYHFGASLKDAGKKWFAFSKLNMDANDILEKLNKL